MALLLQVLKPVLDTLDNTSPYNLPFSSLPFISVGKQVSMKTRVLQVLLMHKKQFSFLSGFLFVLLSHLWLLLTLFKNGTVCLERNVPWTNKTKESSLWIS